MNVMDEKGHLKVQMFGKFEMVYNKQVVKLGHSQTTRAMILLQLLVFSGEEGIHRAQIIQHLFGSEAEGDLRTNLRVVVHNLRKILQQSGLPEGNYISVEDGVYKFAVDFPVTIDVKEFESVLKRAKSVSGSEQYELLKRACDLYKGQFLPELCGEYWVLVNSAHFRELYSECVEKLAGMMKEKRAYKELCKLCNRAAALYPFDEWQVYEMEALLAMGDAKTALALYEETTALYFDELAMQPSDRMLECFQHMREQIQMKTGNISEIQGSLKEKEYLKGAFFCQYPSFADSYRMMARMMERSGQSVYLLTCTLYDEKEKVAENPEVLKEVSELLFRSIQESLRRGDVFTRYNLKQYLVMLTGIRKEECSIVTSRIDTCFRKKYSNRNVRVCFHIASAAFDGEIKQKKLKK